MGLAVRMIGGEQCVELVEAAVPVVAVAEKVDSPPLPEPSPLADAGEIAPMVSTVAKPTVTAVVLNRTDFFMFFSFCCLDPVDPVCCYVLEPLVVLKANLRRGLGARWPISAS